MCSTSPSSLPLYIIRHQLIKIAYFTLGGGHLGRDKTLEKISSKFYWKDMGDDIRLFVRICDTCQRSNDAKFVKTDASLLPIPIKSRVWDQVSSRSDYKSIHTNDLTCLL